jgi:hypothetical protein
MARLAGDVEGMRDSMELVAAGGRPPINGN